MSFFIETANELFKKAEVEKTDAPEMFEEVQTILSEKMAFLSATMGMSKERISIYNEQKQALVDDLITLKKRGHLR